MKQLAATWENGCSDENKASAWIVAEDPWGVAFAVVLHVGDDTPLGLFCLVATNPAILHAAEIHSQYADSRPENAYLYMYPRVAEDRDRSVEWLWVGNDSGPVVHEV